MSYPVKYTIRARQGSTFKRTFTWKTDDTPVDLTGWSAASQVRETAESSNVIADLTDYITLGDEEGTVQLIIPADVLSEIDAGRYVYDLELTNGDEVTAILAGTFRVAAEVTRD